MASKTDTKVKGDAESSYRTGNVNLTPANIGAMPLSGGIIYGQVLVQQNRIDSRRSDNGVSVDTWPAAIQLLDKNGNAFVFFGSQVSPSGDISAGMYAYNNNASGEQIGMNYIRAIIDKSGNLSYQLSSPAAFRTSIKVAAAPTGYNYAARVWLLNYTKSNPYTVSADVYGVIFVSSSWRQNSYTIGYIKTGSADPIIVELAAPTNGNAAGTQSTMTPVFPGQKLWAERNPNVAYGDAYFIPYAY